VIAAPDYVDPLVGWRVWTAARGGRRFRLLSVVYPSLWTPNAPLVSTCLRGRMLWRRGHEAPSWNCDCGIYAARDAGTAAEFLRRFPNKGGNLRVIGRVRLWGRVVESAGGWRASHAYPDELYVPTAGSRLADPGEVVHDLDDYEIPVSALSVDELAAALVTEPR
jgi:hypothetical protein